MSSIGGPGGIGGPKGPSGPGDVDGPDSTSGPDQTDQAAGPDSVAGAGHAPDIDALAADLAAGRLTPHEAVDRLVDQIAGSTDLGPADRAELRELMTDLIKNDPQLAALVGRI
jgi:hypothetical protein